MADQGVSSAHHRDTENTEFLHILNKIHSVSFVLFVAILFPPNMWRGH